MKLLGLVAAALIITTACGGSDSGEPALEPQPTAVDVTTPSSPSAAPEAEAPALPEMVSIDDLVASGASREQATCYVNAGDPNGTGFVTEPDAALEAFGSCLLTNPPQPPGAADG